MCINWISHTISECDFCSKLPSNTWSLTTKFMENIYVCCVFYKVIIYCSYLKAQTSLLQPWYNKPTLKTLNSKHRPHFFQATNYQILRLRFQGNVQKLRLLSFKALINKYNMIQYVLIYVVYQKALIRTFQIIK